jgi:hypothetical protein
MRLHETRKPDEYPLIKGGPALESSVDPAAPTTEDHRAHMRLHDTRKPDEYPLIKAGPGHPSAMRHHGR